MKEYSNTINRTIKMKPADMKPETYLSFNYNYNSNYITKNLQI